MGQHGTRVSDGTVAAGLREITRVAGQLGYDTGDGLGGSDGYGATVRTPVFDMDPYCWCDRADCPQCLSCTCPPESSTYHDAAGAVVSDEEYFDLPRQRRGRIDSRPTCPLCTGAATPAVNFRHHESVTTVRWYKYIGRGMTVDVRGDWSAIVAQCVQALRAAPAPAST